MKNLNIKLKVLIGLSLLTVGLGGCETEADKITTDQCLRQELFQQCMKVLPVGPHTAMSNDWDEVVSECGSQSYYQAQRKREFVKQECGLK